MLPSYNGLKPASEAASRAKQRNRSADTLPELMLRRELWRTGLRYRKNVKNLPGKPDVVFLAARVVVFADGDFWHGRAWQTLEAKLIQGTNGDYWSAKIAANIARDQRNTALLEKDGWLVIRLWETDIKADSAAVAAVINDAVRSRDGSRLKR